VAQRKSDARTRVVVGLFVVALGIAGFISLFIIGQVEGAWESKTRITTDFKTITGLRKGSPVQLAGVEIGTVSSIDFIEAEYACDAATEDRGRYGEGRTDYCDAFLFCAPNNKCADLEEYASKGQHSGCASDTDCGGDEVCVTKEFRRRARRVAWIGPDGVCARYKTLHHRVRVTMTIFEDKLDLIRSDSRATVASNGVLGDQLVNITPGMREKLTGEKPRIQSTPSLYEDLDLFRDRFDGLTDKVDKSLAGISALFSELNDERTIASVKGTVENVEEITRQMAAGEGLIGGLLSDPEMKEDFGVTLRSVKNTAHGVDEFVQEANKTLKKVDENFEPLIADARATAAEVRGVLEDLKDPNNKSLAAKLLYDEEGKLTEDVEKILADAKEATKDLKSVAGKIDRGEGTIGKLVNEAKVHDDLVKILRNIERNDTLKRVVRGVIARDDDAVALDPDVPAKGKGGGGEQAEGEASGPPPPPAP
jgi:ABC-type transporter Mla subunit MlaD